MLQKITTNEFISTFCEIANNADRRFCFVLGAGASKSSGIRTGAELATKWLEEIKIRMKGRDADYRKFLDDNQIEQQNPGVHYADIYKERFRFDETSGFDYINKEMEAARPGYGYSVLAQILADKHHNIVITTNFDNLTEEALYTYTSKRPLVCGHELLASFAKPSANRPLIVKIHRDRFLNPQSKREEIESINKAWVKALNQIFQMCIPVFIGYGGNDGSLMGYLEQIAQFENLFWCERKGTNIPERVEKLLEKHDGKLIEIEGFDELMFLLQDGLKLPLLADNIKTIAEERANKYQDTVLKIQQSQSSSTNEEAQKAAERLVEKAGDDWWAWELKARSAQNIKEKERVYLDAINAFPNSAELHNNFGVFLSDEKDDYPGAVDMYLKSITIDPKYIVPYSNCAYVYSACLKKYPEAENLYKKALALKPKYDNLNGNYAGYLFSKGQYTEGLKYLNLAFNYCDGDALEIELHFYKYAHIKDNIDSSLSELTALININMRSLKFNLQPNVDKAIEDGHPNPKLLQHLADVITKDIPFDESLN